jgi:hypothetical protein
MVVVVMLVVGGRVCGHRPRAAGWGTCTGRITCGSTGATGGCWLWTFYHTTIHMCTWSYSCITAQNENPIDRVRFYQKGKANVAQKIRKTQVCVFVLVLECVLEYACLGVCVLEFVCSKRA